MYAFEALPHEFANITLTNHLDGVGALVLFVVLASIQIKFDHSLRPDSPDQGQKTSEAEGYVHNHEVHNWIHT